MRREAMRLVFYVGLLIILLGGIFVARQAVAGEKVVPGDFKIDPPTLKCLGFRWFIDGDDNRNASVTGTYRKVGETEWKKALPMLRIQDEKTDQARPEKAYICGNLFAGSIFNLEPATEYEVHFMLKDPDGGRAEKTVKAKTRAVPKAADTGRKLNVYPAGFKGKKEAWAFDSIMAAYEAARPGDIILIHAGIYKGSYRLTKSGTEERPIVFRAAGDGEVILDGENAEYMIDIHGTNHLFFEGLSIRNAKTAFYGGGKGPENGVVGLVVRRCHIYDIVMGLNGYSAHSASWYIADNIIIGKNPGWYPRNQYYGKGPAHTGVNIYGRGHIVCYNKVVNFQDCLAIANYGRPKDDPDLHCVSIDFYNNDLIGGADDAIEADYGVSNVRVFNNRMTNCHTGLSTQPFHGGPCYLIKNHLYNMTRITLKLNNYPSGLEIYHNTCVSAHQGFRSPAIWQNGILRNNLFLGGDGHAAMHSGSPTPYTTLDYNGYRRGAPDIFIEWSSTKKKSYRPYSSLQDFYRATGHERHGVMVDYDIFQKATIPIEGKTYPLDFADLRLKPGSAAVDAAVILPNINDDYTGKAPDLGCYELGAPLPHYGPREE